MLWVSALTYCRIVSPTPPKLWCRTLISGVQRHCFVAQSEKSIPENVVSHLKPAVLLASTLALVGPSYPDLSNRRAWNPE